MRKGSHSYRGRCAGQLSSRWIIPGLALVLSGCSLDGLTNTKTLPDDVSDPSVIETSKGALAAHNGVLGLFRDALAGPVAGSYVLASGVLADELSQERSDLDQRRLSDGGAQSGGSNNTYTMLNKVRGQASLTKALFAEYAPDSLKVLGAHLHALEGYATIFLADMFCSGIPLSTLDYNGDFTYKPNSVRLTQRAVLATLCDPPLYKIYELSST